MMATATAAVLATLAIVTQNQASLRAAPKDSAAQQAVLWQGDALEIRGQKLDYLQVYDHRRERAGYIKATQVRTTSLTAAEAPELLSVVRFVRDTPGAEALGISYAAAYLKAVPAQQLTAEPLDALGAMAERLARRASPPLARGNEATLSAQLEGLAQHGLVMKSFEREGGMQICYEGDVFRRVLAMPDATPDQKARAALGLTRHECVDPALRPGARFALDEWRAQVLDLVPLNGLNDLLANRVHARRAGVWAALAHAQQRRALPSLAAGQRAVQELAAVNPQALSDEDQGDYFEAAVRVGASRWAAEVPPQGAMPGAVSIVTSAGEPGQTCVALIDATHDAKAPLFKQCTYGQVWAASASSNAKGTALAVAVQPLDTWRELWVFRKGPQGWTLDVLPPGLNQPELGYLELAGWTPAGDQMLVVRELKQEGKQVRRFEVIKLDTLSTDRQASAPDLLQAFGRFADARWKRGSVALR
jgi:hypothetical protein